MARAKGKLVYVVDDEQIIATTLVLILRQHGFEADAYFDPFAALEACGRTEPDLVISDVVMPGMTGLALAAQIEERFPTCKVLLFSGQAGLAQFYEDGRDPGSMLNILPKPVHPSQLLDRLRTLT